MKGVSVLSVALLATSVVVAASTAQQQKADLGKPLTDAHEQMMKNGYVALTDATGRFEIANVPPGNYTLTLWHEVLGSATKPVTIESGEASTVDFEIGG